MAKAQLKTFDVYWAPTGQKIATVQASTAKAAKSKAPSPYRKYKGEIYVEDRGPVSNMGNGFQIVVPRGTLRNPSKRRSLISKIRKILSNPGGIALDVLSPALASGYAQSGANALKSLYGGGRKRKNKRKSKLLRKRKRR